MQSDKDMKDIILENSIKLFFKLGYNKTTMRLIATESGIKHPSIYKHFKNKDEIMSIFVFRYIRGIVKMTQRYILDHIGISKHDAFLFYWTAHLYYSSYDERFRRYQLEQLNTSSNQILNVNNDYFAQVFTNIMHWEFNKTPKEHKIYSQVLYSIVIIISNMYMKEEIEMSFALSEMFDLMYSVVGEKNPVDEDYVKKFIDALDFDAYLNKDLLEDVFLSDFGTAYKGTSNDLFS
ncbi:TetR/AcrR family transcriptional regulator [Alkalibacter mobilis]|uniref:TetR/AcrR family transcriptional regulator n=1 Tax=Alkalibacter mobilis TaxID=2787712 RepID=UPI00189E06E0|nr:TetR/AcrR family transcriptional regulator [Alkalibacter mobilis]MBF7097770.1 TetR/AcrR family transcriptional regulator [Alkalibacter mobilis]